jgi:hypothetical protein
MDHKPNKEIEMAHVFDYYAAAMSCYCFIAAEQEHYPVKMRCHTLAMALSRYYALYARAEYKWLDTQERG